MCVPYVIWYCHTLLLRILYTPSCGVPFGLMVKESDSLPEDSGFESEQTLHFAAGRGHAVAATDG